MSELVYRFNSLRIHRFRRMSLVYIFPAPGHKVRAIGQKVSDRFGLRSSFTIGL